jgi:hypothetical protein
MDKETMTVVGRAEWVVLPDHGPETIPAKVDTGADVSSIWASHIQEQDGCLEFVLFDEGSKYYTGQVIRIEAANYRLTRIASSFGHRELRYVVKLRLTILGRTIKATFTLADRSQKLYPILLGRRLLKNKFLVDVAKGSPLVTEEKARLEQLHIALSQDED